MRLTNFYGRTSSTSATASLEIAITLAISKVAVVALQFCGSRPVRQAREIATDRFHRAVVRSPASFHPCFEFGVLHIDLIRRNMISGGA
jgi:hypothetical protein